MIIKSFLSCVIFLFSISSLPAQKIHIAFLWHMHQPFYFPGETILETESANHYDYSVQEIHTNRTGPYTSWPADAVQTGVGAGMGHFGSQVSLSGSLIDNLDHLEANGVSGFNNWKSSWSSAVSQSTSLGNPRLDLVAFGYNHPLMALIPETDVEAQIIRHRDRLDDAFSGPVSKGIFPPENAFAAHMVPALVQTGLEWVLVDNIHFERATQNYPFSTSANLVEPNGADQLNDDPLDWQNLNDLWCPTQISGQWAHQPHYTEYIDPDDGTVSRIIAVPASRYIGNEDGRGGFGALQYDQVLTQLEVANTDTAHPILVVIAHDGDNHGGGTDSYYNHNFDQFVAWLGNHSDRFECTTIQDYLHRFPPDVNDVIHVEPGSWSGADNGDPEFKKWNSDPNEAGYSPDRTSWAVMTAASNLVKTVQQSQPDHADVIQAVEHLHTGQSSDYWYWDWAQDGIWDTHPTRAANLSTELVVPLISAGNDTFGPSIFLPQRDAYNPGGYEWTMGQSSDFDIWTLAYDYSGITTIVVKVREDADGLNDPLTSSNELYTGGVGVGAWQDVDMAGSAIMPQTNISPNYIAIEYRGRISEYSNILLDYYVEATDGNGNVSRSPIQHVFVGSQAGAGSGTYGMDGVVDDVPAIATENDLALYADFNGVDLYVAGPSAPNLDQDVFILIGDSPQSMQVSPWAKAGEVANWDVFLANESINNWGGWFDQDGRVELAIGSVLEGLIRVDEQWPDLPDTLFIALATYSTEDGGALLQQLPVGNGNGDVEADEYVAFGMDYSAVGTDEATLPKNFHVGPAFPNPFNPQVQVNITLAHSEWVDVDVFDIKGRHVESLLHRELEQGMHSVPWQPVNQASGLYLIRINNEHTSFIRRVVLNR